MNEFNSEAKVPKVDLRRPVAAVGGGWSTYQIHYSTTELASTSHILPLVQMVEIMHIIQSEMLATDLGLINH